MSVYMLYDNYALHPSFSLIYDKNCPQPMKTGWIDSISYLLFNTCLLNIQNCSGKVLSKLEFE